MVGGGHIISAEGRLQIGVLAQVIGRVKFTGSASAFVDAADVPVGQDRAVVRAMDIDDIRIQVTVKTTIVLCGTTAAFGNAIRLPVRTRRSGIVAKCGF
jgi:hypothetical protein